MFPLVEAAFLEEGEYFHSPMVLSCYRRDSQKRPFRFFNMWTKSDKFLPLVRLNRGKAVEGCHMFRVIQRLKWIKFDLKNLNKEGFNSVEAEDLRLFHAFTEAQTKLHSNPHDSDLATEEKQANLAYKNAHAAYLSYLQQIAKINWLEHGDENTRAFHQSIKQRRKHNKIHSIFIMDGDWVQSADEVQQAFIGFYSSLFGGSIQHKAPVNTIIMDQGVILVESHKSILECPITMNDVKKALFSIPDNKAPGYGWPIAYCSVIYKCISKILCEKTGSVLPDIISQNQGAFVKGRSILHNVLICQDIVKMYKKHQKGPCCLMKLDLKKAYDTVEWGFIEELMVDLGFPSHFVELIMTCLTTTRYSILINSVPIDLIQPRRGLRQGDPLSPLLFTLCMEYFSRAMKLVDDLLMFCKGDKKTVKLMLSAFNLFSTTFSLQINPSKSSIYCCGGTDSLRDELVAVSRSGKGDLPFRYLRVPISTKKLNASDCELLVEKWWPRSRCGVPDIFPLLTGLNSSILC
ncbi:uncharacterized protein [Spinacia oleracea]|uniref:Reverse transcriptase domain-containing protein n=1 Tax=Spinacia oleracea TaxID=3562 RepID=A0ABM3R3P1_SPIOL|nr:uncharacterized protein LOC110799709 [Spinacia oleracea]